MLRLMVASDIYRPHEREELAGLVTPEDQRAHRLGAGRERRTALQEAQDDPDPTKRRVDSGAGASLLA
jgi:hypothetical protein